MKKMNFKLTVIFLAFLGIFSLSSKVLAQSKKDLIKEVEKLKAEKEALIKEKATISNELKTTQEKMTLDLTNDEQKVSYAIGLSIASNMAQQGIIDLINPNALQHALEDAKTGSFKLSPQEADNFLKSYFQALNEKVEKERKEAGMKNKEEGEKFLEENATKEGVVTLPSGLQYLVLKKGSGPVPKATDRVKTHYHGTFLDGKVFDSSVERGQPTSFGVGQVISGWTEALQLMPVGAKWKLFIPYNLAYGAQGSAPKIAPYTTLVFEVELLGIE